MTELLVTPFRPPPFSPTWWSIVKAPVDLHLSKQKLWPKTCRFVEGNQNNKKKWERKTKCTQASQWHADASLNYNPWMVNTDTNNFQKSLTGFWNIYIHFCFGKIVVKCYCIAPQYSETWNSVGLNLRAVSYCSSVAYLSVSSNLPLKRALVYTHGQLKEDSESVSMDQASSHFLCSCFYVVLGLLLVWATFFFFSFKKGIIHPR